MKIYDACIYYDEDILLDLRFNILDRYLKININYQIFEKGVKNQIYLYSLLDMNNHLNKLSYVNKIKVKRASFLHKNNNQQLP